MSDLKAQLQISADASGVEAGVNKAKKSVADLGATAAAAGTKAAAGIKSIGDAGDGAASNVDRAAKSLIASIQRTTAVQEAGSKTGSAYYEVLARQRGIDPAVLKPYLDQLDAVAVKQKVVAQTASAITPALTEAGMSAKATSAALRNVPAQFTDIVVSLQGGQKPLTVLLQQGGQLKDMFGGIAPAARAVGTYVAALVNPFTLTAAAVAVLTYAFVQGRAEAEAFTKAQILSGNAAGTTTSQLGDMARALGVQAQYTQAQAAEALAAITQTGSVGRDNLQQFAQVALDVERATGQSIKKTAEIFTDLEREPLEASIKLNQQIRYLTASSYEQIKALTEQGRATDAARAAQEAYASVMEQRSKQITQNLGFLEVAWHGVTSAASKAWDAMLNVGRANTGNEQLAALKAELADRQRRGPLNSNPEVVASYDKGNAAIAAQIALLDRLNGEQGKSAAADAEKVKSAQALITWDKQGDEFKQKAAKRNEEIKKATIEGQALIAAGLIKQSDLTSRLADIRKKYEDKEGASAAKKLDKSQLGVDLEAIKSQQEQIVGVYQDSEKIIEALHAAGLLSDKEYYESKRGFINLETQAKADALRAEIARMEQEKLKGADALDNQKKITEARTKLAALQVDSATKLIILNTQEAAAAKQLELSYMQARQAAQDYFDSLQRQQGRELSAVGQGTQQRNLATGLNQIDDRYSQQRRELQNEQALAVTRAGEAGLSQEQQKSFAQRLALIDEFQGKALDSYRDYYSKLISTQSDWSLGASEALRNYSDESRNTFKQAGQLASDAFNNLENSITVTNGKISISFSRMVDGVINDLLRMEARQNITGPLANYLSGIFGGADTSQLATGDFARLDRLAGARAGGGSVTAGSAYMVGEQGKEVFMPSSNGTIIPNSALAGGGGGVTINVNNSAGANVQVTGQRRNSDGSQEIDLMVGMVHDRIADELGSGMGPLASAGERRYGWKAAVA